MLPKNARCLKRRHSRLRTDLKDSRKLEHCFESNLLANPDFLGLGAEGGGIAYSDEGDTEPDLSPSENDIFSEYFIFMIDLESNGICRRRKSYN